MIAGQIVTVTKPEVNFGLRDAKVRVGMVNTYSFLGLITEVNPESQHFVGDVVVLQKSEVSE